MRITEFFACSYSTTFRIEAGAPAPADESGPQGVLGGTDPVLIERIRTNHNSIVPDQPDQNRIITRSEPDLYSIVRDRTRSVPRSVLDRTRERGFFTNQYQIFTRSLLVQYQIRTMPARSVLNQNRGPDQHRSARITTNQYLIAPASSNFLQISTRSRY